MLSLKILTLECGTVWVSGIDRKPDLLPVGGIFVAYLNVMFDYLWIIGNI